MQNFMTTIINAVKSWTDGRIKDSAADWNVKDETNAAFIRNKPFYDTREYDTVALTFDGDVTGKETIALSDGVYLVKISDRIPTKDELIGAVVSTNDPSTTEITENMIGDLGDGNLFVVEALFVIATDGFTITDGALSIPSSGIWVMYLRQNDSYVYVSSLSWTWLVSGELKQLNSKYLDFPTNMATTDDVQEAMSAANNAQTTADNAQTAANNAQTTADSKMNATDPVGTGSFSMNRKGNSIIGKYSHAEGNMAIANGKYSHAEGSETIASGETSHAEGLKTTASGESSHAEGTFTKASGLWSHAEGYSTKANGDFSHAEGLDSIASGKHSHAEGLYTKASQDSQHVQGKYNINDSSNIYAHIVGNGTSDTARSNAHTLDWNGLGWFAGGLKVGGTGQDDAAARDVLLAPATASVGQAIVVKAIDANGKPTEWECADSAIVVTVSQDENGSLVADKTFAELYDAVMSGTTCYCLVDGMGLIIPFSTATQQGIRFTFWDITDESTVGALNATTVTITNEDLVATAANAYKLSFWS